MFRIRLKELRENMGLSQREFASQLNISSSAVGMWESGAREPKSLNELQRIADFFDVTIDYLLGRDEKKPTPEDGDGLSESAQRFMPLVDRLTPAQQELLLSQLQAWNEQNQKQALAAQQSGEERGPKSDS